MERRDRSVLIRLSDLELAIIAGGAARQSRPVASFARLAALDRARDLLKQRDGGGERPDSDEAGGVLAEIAPPLNDGGVDVRD